MIPTGIMGMTQHTLHAAGSDGEPPKDAISTIYLNSGNTYISYLNDAGSCMSPYLCHLYDNGSFGSVDRHEALAGPNSPHKRDRCYFIDSIRTVQVRANIVFSYL